MKRLWCWITEHDWTVEDDAVGVGTRECLRCGEEQELLAGGWYPLGSEEEGQMLHERIGNWLSKWGPG